MRVLNVGGNSKLIPLPPHYAGWENLLVDIEPRGNPEIVGDARELECHVSGQFDAIYCSHNLEVHARWSPRYARIPARAEGRWIRGNPHPGRRIGDAARGGNRNRHRGRALHVTGGPITARDVLYGYATEIERSGQDYYAHKTGFTNKSLAQTLHAAGFKQAFLMRVPIDFELRAFAFKTLARSDQCAMLGLSAGNR